MSEAPDNSNAVLRPPIVWGLTLAAALGLEWLYPLPFLPAALPARWLGVGVFAAGLLLALWAIATIRGAGSQVDTLRPTTAIVSDGPFRYTRNPIYIGMILGQIGVAIGFNTLWCLAALVPFYAVVRYGVVAREEAYLERKFAATYLDYKSRVARWLF